MKIKDITEGTFTNAVLKTNQMLSRLAGRDWTPPEHLVTPDKPRAPLTQMQPTQNPSSTPAPAKPTAPRPTSAAAMPPAAAEPTPQKRLAPGVQIINREPIIIRFQNKEFSLNDRGSWIATKTGKEPPQALQAFLDQQADFGITSTTKAPPRSVPKPLVQPTAGEQARTENPYAGTEFEKDWDNAHPKAPVVKPHYKIQGGKPVRVRQ